MTNLDSAVHIFQLDARSAASQLPAEIAAHKLMTIDVQPEIILDAARDRAGLHFRLRI